jgi:hypothetical protein
MSYGIGLQWDGASAKRPNFMRQNPFVPCNLGNFFGLNGITTGIAHLPLKKAKVAVEYKCGSHRKTNKCTVDQVDLGKTSGSYCRMCYKKTTYYQTDSR